MNTASEQMSPGLVRLLEAGLRFAPRYPPDDNSDHLPMALCAMAGLGADDDALREFERDHSTWQATVAGPVFDVEHPLDHLGDYAAYLSLLRVLQGHVERVGPVQAVAEVLPRLLPALAAEAFHPTIRLGYGLRFGCDVEVAAALAYMIASYVDVPLAAEPCPARIHGVAQAQAQALPWRFHGERFGTRLTELVGAGGYPVPVNATLDEIATLALEIYRGTRNFFALHLVTATQACRELARVVGEAQVAHALGPAVLAAHRIVGSPAFDKTLPAPADLDPEHAIKYVYSCLVEHRLDRAGYADEISAFWAAGLLPATLSVSL